MNKTQTMAHGVRKLFAHSVAVSNDAHLFSSAYLTI
jgi:hypothetical protein